MTSGAERFPIAGIGGSAGSLVTFQEILANLPADAGLAVVIVSHQEQRTRISLQRDVQGINRFEIQMIRGFVQNEEVRFL